MYFKSWISLLIIFKHLNDCNNFRLSFNHKITKFWDQNCLAFPASFGNYEMQDLSTYEYAWLLHIYVHKYVFEVYVNQNLAIMQCIRMTQFGLNLYIDIEIALSAFPKITSTLDAHKASPRALRVPFKWCSLARLSPTPNWFIGSDADFLTTGRVFRPGLIGLDSCEIIGFDWLHVCLFFINFSGPIGQYGLTKYRSLSGTKEVYFISNLSRLFQEFSHIWTIWHPSRARRCLTYWWRDWSVSNTEAMTPQALPLTPQTTRALWW